MGAIGEGSGAVKSGQRVTADVTPARKVPQCPAGRPVNVSKKAGKK